MLEIIVKMKYNIENVYTAVKLLFRLFSLGG